MSNKIAIVGFAHHLDQAPYEDPEWEVWGLNRLHTKTEERRFDRWFNLHDLEALHGSDDEHLDFLRSFSGPVYLRPQDIGKFDIPNELAFPYDGLVEKYGNYFNNTVSWLIAFAMDVIAFSTPETMVPTGSIALYGIDMAQDNILHAEYSQQRPSCEYFLGVARGRGLEVVIPPQSDLLKATHLYGFEDASPMANKMTYRLNELGSRKQEVKENVAKLEAQQAQLEAEKQRLLSGVNQLDGAMQDIQYWLRNWVPQDSEESGA